VSAVMSDSSVNHRVSGCERSTIKTTCSVSNFAGDMGVSRSFVKRVPPPNSHMWQTSWQENQIIN
jgi:hypothetical protein